MNTNLIEIARARRLEALMVLERPRRSRPLRMRLFSDPTDMDFVA